MNRIDKGHLLLNLQRWWWVREPTLIIPMQDHVLWCLSARVAGFVRLPRGKTTRVGRPRGREGNRSAFTNSPPTPESIFSDLIDPEVNAEISITKDRIWCKKRRPSKHYQPRLRNKHRISVHYWVQVSRHKLASTYHRKHGGELADRKNLYLLISSAMPLDVASLLVPVLNQV